MPPVFNDMATTRPHILQIEAAVGSGSHPCVRSCESRLRFRRRLEARCDQIATLELGVSQEPWQSTYQHYPVGIFVETWDKRDEGNIGGDLGEVRRVAIEELTVASIFVSPRVFVEYRCKSNSVV